MKKSYSLIALVVFALTLTTHALAVSVTDNTSASVTTPIASTNLSAQASASAQEKASLKAAVDSFKQNLVQLKGATPQAKLQFAVDTFTKAYTFFTTEHDKFVAALNTSENAGVDVTDAKAHFDSAAQSLTQANTDIQTLSTIEISTSTKTDAKATAKKAETELRETRAELRAGAASLRAAIIVHYHLTTPAGSTSGSANVTEQ